VSRQLPLPLPTRPGYRRADLVVGAGNAEAVAWIDRWPDWPQGLLVLAGPPGCGKRHLAEVWRQRSGAPLLLAAEFGQDDPPTLASSGAAAVTAAEDLRSEAALLHLVNLLRERRGTLLLTGRDPPARWPLRLPDLRSRLLAAPLALVARPDDAMLAALAGKLAADRQLVLGAGVVEYLVARGERRYDALAAAIAQLDQHSLAAHRAITLALAREVLTGLRDTIAGQ